MEFIKWIYEQYKEYRIYRDLPEMTQEEKERTFVDNFIRCKEVGFSEEQIIALLNLVSSK